MINNLTLTLLVHWNVGKYSDLIISFLQKTWKIGLTLKYIQYLVKFPTVKKICWKCRPKGIVLGFWGSNGWSDWVESRCLVIIIHLKKTCINKKLQYSSKSNRALWQIQNPTYYQSQKKMIFNLNSSVLLAQLANSFWCP